MYQLVTRMRMAPRLNDVLAVLLCVFVPSIVATTGMRVFESEIIKRIFQQKASFCFQPFEAEGCNETLWERIPAAGEDDSNLVPKTMVFLFTPRNPKYPEFLHECGGQLPRNTNFNPRHKTEIFIHGFLDGACRSAWMREMIDQLFKRGLYNVILVDWTWGNGPNYNSSTGNTKVVGKQLSFLIQNIMDQSGVGPENFHLVGHSLGAHIAGFAGKIVKHLRRITGEFILIQDRFYRRCHMSIYSRQQVLVDGKIVMNSLDPALTPFQNLTKLERLDSSDANLVDVIHTNGGTQPGESLGDINPLGHADFYPNGGMYQDSCRRHIVKSYLSLDFLYATISLVPRICSHMHAVQFYKATINPKKCEFIGVECPDYDSFLSGQCSECYKDVSNCAVMGMNHEDFYLKRNWTSSSPQFRKFYLNTTIEYPYCDNSGITFEKSEVYSAL